MIQRSCDLYTRWGFFFFFPSASFILSPGLQIPGMSAQRQETETKSSWAKCGPDNKTILYLLAFLPFCRLCMQYWITLPYTHREREKKMCVFGLFFHWFAVERKRHRNEGKEAKLKAKLYIYTLTDYSNPFFAGSVSYRQGIISAHVLLCMHTKIKRSVKVLCWGPWHSSFVLHRDSLWTQGQGQGGLKVTTD